MPDSQIDSVRGYAIPLIGRVLRHGSSSVRLEVYQLMLKRAARLVPTGVSVQFLADRGFADTKLRHYLCEDLQWHFRIRVKSRVWICRTHQGWKQPSNIALRRQSRTLE
ncbi:hypothetical protein [Leptothermofonsia sp. ETS-13]|uniref:hypothetical protein n=1 Tax=Leptothermofonsia sp. ETS-13 TaxID=3035696 RepID=UPI003B9F4076